MLHELGLSSRDELIAETIPDDIRIRHTLDLPSALAEGELLEELRQIAGQNRTLRNFIGRGYYGTITPPVILRNILEDPGWYTQYTPYQSEISQGRLEILLNFQTMIADSPASRSRAPRCSMKGRRRPRRWPCATGRRSGAPSSSPTAPSIRRPSRSWKPAPGRRASASRSVT